MSEILPVAVLFVVLIILLIFVSAVYSDIKAKRQLTQTQLGLKLKNLSYNLKSSPRTKRTSRRVKAHWR